MRNGLATLHDPDDRCLGLVMPVGSHALVCGLVLLLGLFQLDLINFDPHLGVREPGIVREFVRDIDIPAFRLLAEDAVFGACQRLKRPLKFLVG